jgi:hypothetical protein
MASPCGETTGYMLLVPMAMSSKQLNMLDILKKSKHASLGPIMASNTITTGFLPPKPSCIAGRSRGRTQWPGPLARCLVSISSVVLLVWGLLVLRGFCFQSVFCTHAWMWVCFGPSIYFSRFLLLFVYKNNFFSLLFLFESQNKTDGERKIDTHAYNYKSISHFIVFWLFRWVLFSFFAGLFVIFFF